MKFQPCTVAFLAAFGTLPLTSDAALSITIQEVGPDVVVSASGTVNLADLGPPDLTDLFAPLMVPSQADVRLGTGASADAYTTVSGPSSFGSGGFAFPSSNSGDFIGLTSDSLSQILVPEGYVSGDPLSGTSTYGASTLNSIGLTPGTYQWTWGAGANEDSATLTVVPEPGAFAAILGLSVLGFLFIRRRL